MSAPVQELLELSQKQPHSESMRRDMASFRAFEQKLERRQRRARTWRLGLVLSAAAALALAVWQWPTEQHGLALQYEITRGAASQDASVGSQLKFSDGSTVGLGNDSSAHVRATTQLGAHVVLQRGSARVAVVPKKHNDWWFEAGPYRVHVIGTVFDVAWQPERQLFQLHLSHGVVEVTGPLVGKGVTLREGQRLTATPAQQRLLIENAATHTADATPAPAVDVDPEQALDEIEDRAPSAAHPTRKRTNKVEADLDFETRVARGDFAGVVASAQRVGINKLLQRASADDLTALADAARYVRDDHLARKTLLRLHQRFPASASGKSAPFLLARLSQGRDAARWYERYLEEQPNGPYTKQALGRLMTLHTELGETAHAKARARSYLVLDPAGPYAASARKILAASATSLSE